MRKLLFILMLSTVVALTSGCGSRRTDEEFDEAEAIGLILIDPEEEEEHTDYYEQDESDEKEPDTPATVPVNTPRFVPSSIDTLDYKKLIGEFTSDNGNVYSVKFYTSPKDERVGVIEIDHPKMDFKESLEIVEIEPNAFQVYEMNNYFVFDMSDEDYTLAFYKDGLFADITVKTKNYKQAKGFID